jgi:hypothetical protein
MLNSYVNALPSRLTEIFTDTIGVSPGAMLTELFETQLGEVAGGLNPQPLPPRVEPDRL